MMPTTLSWEGGDVISAKTCCLANTVAVPLQMLS